MEPKQISQNGINLIKSEEQCRLTPYRDEGGLWTIGWGHLIKPGEHFTEITQEEADNLLLNDLQDAENCVNTCVKVPIDQNQFDALVSHVFNIGEERFKNSTMLKILNSNQST